MCGIAGLWSLQRLETDLGTTARAMADTLRHRGPDDEGVWVDPDVGLALGHRRLSVVDLSPLGHQPMASPSGRFVIVFNGEIYNFRSLRKELECRGSHFRSNSDTEVLLGAMDAYGVAGALRRVVGMFAFAVYDRTDRQLWLARDRFGEKPLYYGWLGDALAFGSELRALRAAPQWRGTVDRDALALFLRHNYVPAPYSIFAGIHKVRPGHLVCFDVGRAVKSPVETEYWSAEAVVVAGREGPALDYDEATDSVLATLRRAVCEQMLADVPIGAFLSGGVDSSLIVALMQSENPSRIRTFSIGFPDQEYDEAPAARLVARHLGTDHTDLYLTPDDLLGVVPRLPHLYDEPFSDSSQIPTVLISELARQHVTVCLSGDGGDELFGGYDRYFVAERLWRMRQRVPAFLRHLGGRFLQSISPGAWDRLAGTRGGARGITGERLHKAADLMTARTDRSFYRCLVSHWRHPRRMVTGSRDLPSAFDGLAPSWDDSGGFAMMMWLDSVTYLPDDILVKVDRASMSAGLETRAPFLDHRVYEQAWRLPLSFKIRDGRGKRILKDALARFIPAPLVHRPKQGFAVPLAQWLRGPLREWAGDLLSSSRVRAGGFFDAATVSQRWQEHQRGRGQWHYLLWDILMFEAWLDAEPRAVAHGCQ